MNMTRTLIRTILIVVAAANVACSSSFYAEKASYDSDDMYSSHSRSDISKKSDNLAQLKDDVRNRRMAEWAEVMGFDAIALNEKYSGKEYDTPYGDKIRSLNSAYYRYPQSYYNLKYQEDALDVLADYDPAKYNATMDSEGRVTVAPKYISSMYGSWNIPYYYDDFWVYGYPTYSWYDPYPYGFGYGYPIGYAGAFSFGVGFGIGFGYPGYYPYAYPGFYPGFYYPYAPIPYYSHAPRSIVPHERLAGGTYIGKRQPSGATVGRTSGSYYNRGGASTTYAPQYRSTTPTRVPSMGGGAVRTNSFGR